MWQQAFVDFIGYDLDCLRPVLFKRESFDNCHGKNAGPGSWVE
jgi:hypothetical protein